MDLDFRPIDADNHYYETVDACTRHLPKEFARRGVRVVQEGKRTLVLHADKVSYFIPNPTFDPIIVPGCLDLMFRGQVPEGVNPRELTRVEPMKPEYRDRDARLAVMDEQGLERVLLFPTLACGVEHGLRGDVEATMASIHAFNQWLDEDWGFDYQGRVMGVPLLSLADPTGAIAEIDWLQEHGARVVHVRPAPVPGPDGGRSFGAPEFDPVWARLVEADLPVAFHLGDSGYMDLAAMWGGLDHFEPFRPPNALDRLLVSDRAIHDTIGSLVCHGVFTRHPDLRVASIENGSEWVHTLVKRLRKLANQIPSAFPDDPLDVIRHNVWVAPYFEEDIRKLADTIGVERILFGSDWPHGEGLAAPLDFVKELHAFDAAETRAILRDNCLALISAE